MENKKTLVIGASENRARYSNKAIHLLRRYRIEVLALAKRTGKVGDVEIVTEFPEKKENIHTVTLYVGPQNQPGYYDSIISIQPKRVIFNPGTENSEFVEKLRDNGIEVVSDCTLVMLNTGRY